LSNVSANQKWARPYQGGRADFSRKDRDERKALEYRSWSKSLSQTITLNFERNPMAEWSIDQSPNPPRFIIYD